MARHRSPIFAQAVAAYHHARAEYQLHLEQAYRRAEHELAGALLNARGRRAAINPYRLFMGNETFARAYASEELIDHWQKHPRLTWTAFEHQYTSTNHPEEQAS